MSLNIIEVLPRNILKLEELEAIRLKNLEGLEQDKCVGRIEISMPTFQRILLLAIGKIAALKNVNINLMALCLRVSHDCNLRCEYCFASKRDYSIGIQ